MSPELVGVVAIIGAFALLFLRVPIAFAFAFVAFLGYLAISGMEPALKMVGLIPYAKVAVYSFTAIPLFIIMGHFAYHGGIARDLFNTTRLWVGGFPGGLVQATIAGAAAFGAACGSGPASCAVVSKVTIPEMVRVGVDRKLAFGAAAATGTIAQMIPPSVLMVIYGIIAEQSVGRLLIAGILPGITISLVYMSLVYIRVRKNPQLAPAVKGVTWRERLVSLRGLWGVVLLAALVMGGIWTGIFTPTEAGGVGAFGAFIMALGKLRLPQLRECLLDTVRTTGAIFLIVSCAFIFGYVISISHLARNFSEILIALPKWWLLAGVVVMYIILGFFLDMIAAMFITLPIVLPAIAAAEFNLIWFGVLMVFLCELALITPPYGINLFVVKTVIPWAEMSEIISGIWPFVLAGFVILVLFILFPQIALFLPTTMMGK